MTDPRRLPTGTWVLGWLVGLTLLVLGAFLAGAAHFEATECRGPEVGDCDLGGLEGLFWAAAALVLGAAGWIADAVRRSGARRALSRG